MASSAQACRSASLRVFRVSGFEKMLLLYLPRRDGVEVLRVVHASRNLQALLRREGLKQAGVAFATIWSGF